MGLVRALINNEYLTKGKLYKWDDYEENTCDYDEIDFRIIDDNGHKRWVDLDQVEEVYEKLKMKVDYLFNAKMALENALYSINSSKKCTCTDESCDVCTWNRNIKATLYDIEKIIVKNK